MFHNEYHKATYICILQTPKGAHKTESRKNGLKHAACKTTSTTRIHYKIISGFLPVLAVQKASPSCEPLPILSGNGTRPTVLKSKPCEPEHGNRALIRENLMATGRKPIPLDIPTPCEQIHFCAICDGAAYKNKSVLVVGGGNSAFDEGLYLLNLGVARLTVVECMDRFFAAKATQDALLADERVQAHTQTKVVDVVLENNVLKKAILENTRTHERSTLDVDGIFVFQGQAPNNEWFADAIELDEKGYVLAKEDMSTSIPGVFSAGDINRKQFRQITTAVGDGTIAALAAERWLRSRECFVSS